MLTKEQLAQRSKGLGASEIPSILGMDENRTAFQVWLEKTQPQVAQESTPQQDRGHFAEAMIAAMYARDHADQVFTIEAWQQTIPHPSNDWLFATPDYSVFKFHRARDRVLECKTTAKYLDEEKCPEAYEAQARTQIAVLNHLGIQSVDIAALNGGAFVSGKPYYWTIERDEDQEKKIIEVAHHWWNKHVIEKIEPDPDASEEYARYCNLQPSKGKVLEVAEDHPLFKVISTYHEKKERLKEIEQDCDLVGNELRHALLEIDCVKGSFGALYYKSVKGNTKTHWEQVARMLANYVVVPGYTPTAETVTDTFNKLVAKYTETGPSYRKLNPRWSK